MGDVISFARKIPHIQGAAFCFACDHEWQAVAPVGTVELECPSCRAMKGRYRCEIVPEGVVKTCECGCQMFYITTDGTWCPNCGTYDCH